MTGPARDASTVDNVLADQRPRLRALRAAAILALGAVSLSEPAWEEPLVRGAIMLSGLLLLQACVLGRLWCALYIGGRQGFELVRDGPYAMTRNPLYFFSSVGAAGVGLLFGSLVAGALFFSGVALAHLPSARSEARFLRQRFGEAYAAYAARVPFFWPVPPRRSSPSPRSFQPEALRRTFADVVWLLAACPLLLAVDAMQAKGAIPVLFRMY